MSLLPLNTMLGRLKIVEVLGGDDAPCIFMAENASGSRYLAFLADEHKEESLWLYAPVSESRVDSLLAGKVDLRSIYTAPEDGLIFQVRLLGETTASVEVVQPEEVEPDLLPPEDDFLAPEVEFLPDEPAAAKKPGKKGTKKAGPLIHQITIKRPRSSAPVTFEALASVAANWAKLLHLVLDAPPVLVEASAGSLIARLQTDPGPALSEFLERLGALLATPTPEQISVSLDYHTCKRLEVLLDSLYQDKLTLSVQLVSSKASPLVLSYSGVHDLRGALIELNQHSVDSAEVPQADDLSKLFKMLELIQAGEVNLSYHLSLSQRHINYYKHAARILDFINDGGAITTRGQYLLNLPLVDRYEVTMMFFESSPVGFAWLRYAGVKCALHLDPESAETFLMAQCPNLSPATVGRRSQTLRYWVASFKEKLPD